MRLHRGLRAGAAGLALVQLAGCEAVRDADRHADQTASRLAALATQTPPENRETGDIVVHGGSLIMGHIVRNGRGDPLPARWEGDKSYGLQSNGPVSIHDAADRVLARTGIPVAVVDGADLTPGSGPAAAQTQVALASSGAGPSGGLGLRGTLIAEANGADGPAARPSSGPSRGGSQHRVINCAPAKLSAILDCVGQTFDVSWRYRLGRIEFYRFVTATFDIEAMNVQVSMSIGDGATSGTSSSSQSANGGAGGVGALSFGGGASGTDTASSGALSGGQSLKVDYYADLGKTLDSIMPPDARYALNPSTGRLVMVGRPASVELVREFISSENRTAGRDISVMVEVVSLDINDSDEFGVDLTTVFNDPSTGLVYKLAGAPTALSEGVAVLGATVEGADGRFRQFKGSSAAVQALAHKTRNAEVRTFQGRGQSNSLIKVQRTRDTDVIRSSQTVVVPQSGTLTNSQLDTIAAGLKLVTVPRVLADGRIRMVFGLDLSSLVDLINEQIGTTSKLTRAITDKSVYGGTFTLRSGASVILTGLVEDTSSKDQRGTGVAWNPIFGGSTSGSRGHRQFFVVITPIELGT